MYGVVCFGRSTVCCMKSSEYNAQAGGGFTFMADVTQMPKNAFGYVPTPALVAPIEFTMSRADYQALGGHMDYVMPLEQAMQGLTGRQNDHRLSGRRSETRKKGAPWPVSRSGELA